MLTKVGRNRAVFASVLLRFTSDTHSRDVEFQKKNVKLKILKPYNQYIIRPENESTLDGPL